MKSSLMEYEMVNSEETITQPKIVNRLMLDMETKVNKSPVLHVHMCPSCWVLFIISPMSCVHNFTLGGQRHFCIIEAEKDQVL